jgi:hypothetical protein
MVEKGNALSRNPNICASCSSLVDGMEESSVASLDLAASVGSVRPESIPFTTEPASKTGS